MWEASLLRRKTGRYLYKCDCDKTDKSIFKKYYHKTLIILRLHQILIAMSIVQRAVFSAIIGHNDAESPA